MWWHHHNHFQNAQGKANWLRSEIGCGQILLPTHPLQSVSAESAWSLKAKVVTVPTLPTETGCQDSKQENHCTWNKGLLISISLRHANALGLVVVAEGATAGLRTTMHLGAMLLSFLKVGSIAPNDWILQKRWIGPTYHSPRSQWGSVNWIAGGDRQEGLPPPPPQGDLKHNPQPCGCVE